MAQVLVMARDVEHGDLALQLADPVDTGHAALDLPLLVRACHLPLEAHDASLHAAIDVVEDRELRVVPHGPAHFVGEPRVAPILRGRGGHCGQQGHEHEGSNTGVHRKDLPAGVLSITSRRGKEDASETVRSAAISRTDPVYAKGRGVT